MKTTKLRNIIFNENEIKSTLAGKKIQLILPVGGAGWNPNDTMTCRLEDSNNPRIGLQAYFQFDNSWIGTKSPYRVGDKVWVKEKYYADADSPMPQVLYFADHHSERKWLSAHQMPRHFSRLTIEITQVRVIRLNDLSETDAIKNHTFLTNCSCWFEPKNQIGRKTNHQNWCQIHGLLFNQIWDKKYASKNLGWRDNPWVWLFDFKIV